MASNQLNKSYLWAWDNKQGWNYSTFFSFFNDFHREDAGMEYVEFAAITFLALCSLVVNSLLIIFFLRRRELRTDQHMYTISIMLSSILMVPVAVLIGMTRLSSSGWMYGDIACKITLFVLCTTAFIKIWLMTLISVDRYLRVVHSHKHYIGHKLSITLILAAWILPAATMAGMTFPNSGAMDIGNVSICTVAFKYHPTIRTSVIYFSTTFAAEFILPAIIMTVCYALIMRKIKQSTARLMRHVVSSQKKLVLSSKATDKGLRSNIRRRRTTIILITILVLFLVMWLPLFAVLAGATLDQMFATYQMSSRWVVGELCVLLLNTLIEPILYAFTTSKVRAELRRSFKTVKPFDTKNNTASFVDDTSTQNCSTNS